MDITDKEIFDAVTSNDPAPAAQDDVNTPQPETEPGQPRDEGGRFAPKSQDDPNTPPVEPAPQQNADPAGNVGVPPGRLREESEARRRAEAEKAELQSQLMQMQQQIAALSRQPVQPQAPQQPQEAPDWYTDPEAAMQHAVSPHLQQFQQMLDYNARLAANAVYKAEVVADAEKAFLDALNTGKVDRADYERVLSAPNRYEAAVQWHKRQSLLSEVGDDPQAYRQRILDEALKDPAFIARVAEAARQPGTPQAQAPGAPVVRLPPSLNSQTAVASGRSGADGDVSDAELFRQTTSARR